MSRATAASALIATALLLGGCSHVTTPPQPSNAPSVAALSDDDTRAQVIDPVKTIVRSLRLDVALASFAFSSCNDDGVAPFRGTVDANVAPPPGTSPQALQQKIQQSLIEQGWANGPGNGRTMYGASVHKGEMFATLGVNGAQTTVPDTVNITIYGECRNQGDHHGRPGDTVITDELVAS